MLARAPDKPILDGSNHQVVNGLPIKGEFSLLPVYYVSGHPDDAILFRGDQLYFDIHAEGVETVQIFVSAGDAGRVDGWWQARERAAVESVKAHLNPAPEIVDAPIINGRPIQRYRGTGWSSYFLRLPDGGLDGQGFSAYGNRSLTKLKGNGLAINAVDGSATYPTWASLVATLRAIIANHRAPDHNAWVNTSDPNSTINPGDHPDHYMVSDAVRSFAPTDWLNQSYWLSYVTKDRPVNLFGLGLDAKRLQFMAYADALQFDTGTPPNETEWNWWGGRSYSRNVIV